MELARAQDATKWTWEEEEGKEPKTKTKKRKRQKSTYETHQMVMKRKNNLTEAWDSVSSEPPSPPPTSAYSALNCPTQGKVFPHPLHSKTNNKGKHTLGLYPDSGIDYYKDSGHPDRASALYHALLASIDFGQSHSPAEAGSGAVHAIEYQLQNTGVAWFGDEEGEYNYCNIPRPHRSMRSIPALLEARKQVEETCGCIFNSIMCAYYKDGTYYSEFASEDDTSLGHCPNVAMLVLGGARVMVIRSKILADSRVLVPVYQNNLIFAYHKVQEYHEYAFPPLQTKGDVPATIILTFRYMKTKSTPLESPPIVIRPKPNHLGASFTPPAFHVVVPSLAESQGFKIDPEPTEILTIVDTNISKQQHYIGQEFLSRTALEVCGIHMPTRANVDGSISAGVLSLLLWSSAKPVAEKEIFYPRPSPSSSTAEELQTKIEKMMLARNAEAKAPLRVVRAWQDPETKENRYRYDGYYDAVQLSPSSAPASSNSRQSPTKDESTHFILRRKPLAVLPDFVTDLTATPSLLDSTTPSTIAPVTSKTHSRWVSCSLEQQLPSHALLYQQPTPTPTIKPLAIEPSLLPQRQHHPQTQPQSRLMQSPHTLQMSPSLLSPPHRQQPQQLPQPPPSAALQSKISLLMQQQSKPAPEGKSKTRRRRGSKKASEASADRREKQVDQRQQLPPQQHLPPISAIAPAGPAKPLTTIRPRPTGPPTDPVSAMQQQLLMGTLSTGVQLSPQQIMQLTLNMNALASLKKLPNMSAPQSASQPSASKQQQPIQPQLQPQQQQLPLKHIQPQQPPQQQLHQPPATLAPLPNIAVSSMAPPAAHPLPVNHNPNHNHNNNNNNNNNDTNKSDKNNTKKKRKHKNTTTTKRKKSPQSATWHVSSPATAKPPSSNQQRNDTTSPRSFIPTNTITFAATPEPHPHSRPSAQQQQQPQLPPLPSPYYQFTYPNSPYNISYNSVQHSAQQNEQYQQHSAPTPPPSYYAINPAATALRPTEGCSYVRMFPNQVCLQPHVYDTPTALIKPFMNAIPFKNTEVLRVIVDRRKEEEKNLKKQDRTESKQDKEARRERKREERKMRKRKAADLLEANAPVFNRALFTAASSPSHAAEYHSSLPSPSSSSSVVPSTTKPQRRVPKPTNAEALGFLYYDDDIYLDDIPDLSTKKSRKKAKKEQRQKRQRRQPPQKSEADGVRRFCICRSTEEYGFMICCDSCNEWYHAGCIGMKEDAAAKLETFVCLQCVPHQPSISTLFEAIASKATEKTEAWEEEVDWLELGEKVPLDEEGGLSVEEEDRDDGQLWFVCYSSYEDIKNEEAAAKKVRALWRATRGVKTEKDNNHNTTYTTSTSLF